MRKPIIFLSVLFFFSPFFLFSQCTDAPSAPACSGVEALAFDTESINQGSIKWFYGGTTIFGSLTLNGGTLIVCGDLTVDRFYMDSGTVFIRPGGRFVIGSGIGAGLILKGNSAIYNYGTLECQRNLSLDNGYASASKPNIIINATRNSVFTMANQYLVINNPHSSFINKGVSHFWGVITDQMSSAGSICMGNGSSMRMSILINKVANAYRAPEGNACVYVNQYSQFFGQLTSSPDLFVCLANGHTSDSGCIPFGCTPNNWGAAQVFTNCAGCNALSVLSLKYNDFSAENNSGENVSLSWRMNIQVPNGKFTLLRSSNGRDFIPIDSITVTNSNQATFNAIDNDPIAGENFYMINYIDPNNRNSINSHITRVSFDAISIYPSPFDGKFFIRHGESGKPEKIMITDITGQNIQVRMISRNKGITEVEISNKIQPGIYIIHILTGNNVIAKTIMKN
jgi:hypothetical protein